jgi:hypothetical protein
MAYSTSAQSDLIAAYMEMAADSNRECEALEWCNALIGDVAAARAAP